MAASTGLSLENEVFSKFAFYAGVVLIKTVVMSLWTARYRIPRKVFITPEDYVLSNTPVSLSQDADVERVRRCHQNDLENVLPFVLIGLLYVLTGPELSTALLVFRLFAGSRLLHTIVYLNAVPQPSRALLFFVGIGVNIYMAVAVLRSTSF